MSTENWIICNDTCMKNSKKNLEIPVCILSHFGSPYVSVLIKKYAVCYLYLNLQSIDKHVHGPQVWLSLSRFFHPVSTVHCFFIISCKTSITYTISYITINRSTFQSSSLYYNFNNNNKRNSTSKKKKNSIRFQLIINLNLCFFFNWQFQWVFLTFVTKQIVKINTEKVNERVKNKNGRKKWKVTR